MKNSILGLVVYLAFVACDDTDLGELTCHNPVPATVRDLSGLDGCGFVFELSDGSKLQPFMLGYCGTPPLPKEVTDDPLFDFEWVDGKQVLIAYEVVPEVTSSCMVGEIVKITCLQEIDTNEK